MERESIKRRLIKIIINKIKQMRKAEIQRNTKETKILVLVNLDGSGAAKISTGINSYHKFHPKHKK